jgi:hypothetical protein
MNGNIETADVIIVGGASSPKLQQLDWASTARLGLENERVATSPYRRLRAACKDYALGSCAHAHTRTHCA